jgi:polysaccharide export outer membrane protein
MKSSYFITVVFTSLVVLLLTSCGTTKKRIDRNFNYFQTGLDSIGRLNYKDPLIVQNDVLSIQVYSNTVNPEQTLIFNQANAGAMGMAQGAAMQVTGGMGVMLGYQVDSNGDIIFPVLGKVKAAGKTKEQLAKDLENKLATYVKAPQVSIRYLQFRVQVLGEVKTPGMKVFPTERVTLFDALAMAGDLTDMGRRDNVILLREEGNERKHYVVDLRNSKFLSSEAFQLKQNDVIYVPAKDFKLKQLGVNPNAQRDIQIGLSVLSVLTIIVSLVNIFR